MPRGSRNRVIVQREIEPAHRALRKLRATSSVMAPISFCTSRCPRCWIWRKRHPAPHCAPLPCVAYPPQCVRFADYPRKRGSHDVATVDGECSLSIPVAIFCSAADGCMRASGFPTLRPFQKTGIVAAPESCATMLYGRGPLAPRVLNAVKTMGHVLPASQSPRHVGCMMF
jgi:hypothetical protein